MIILDTSPTGWSSPGRKGIADVKALAEARKATGGSWQTAAQAAFRSATPGEKAAAGLSDAAGGAGEAGGRHVSREASSMVSFNEAVRAVVVLLNAFLALDRRNQVCVISNGSSRSSFLFPVPNTRQSDSSGSAISPAQAVLTAIRETTEAAGAPETPGARAATAGGSAESSGSLSSSLAQGLCYIARATDAVPTLQSRILVVQAAPDSAPLYVATMNCIFSCEKKNVPVDSCVLTDDDSSILQQAAYKTHGVYFRPTKLFEAKALASSMVSLFLPDSYTRGLLVSPLQAGVDMRAACFCHRRPQAMAYVCPVCLTIWCEKGEECKMCGAVAPDAAHVGSPARAATLGMVPTQPPPVERPAVPLSGRSRVEHARAAAAVAAADDGDAGPRKEAPTDGTAPN